MNKITNIIIVLLALTFKLNAQVNSDYHYVNGYFRKDGTYVRGHYKTSPNYTNRDNYTTKPNVNPWTGEPGYLEPDGYWASNYTYAKTPEILSYKYNMALELNDRKKYEESLLICEKLVLEYEQPFHTMNLIGWNYIGLGKYGFAEKTFESIYVKYSKSYFVLSQLYIACILNNNPERAQKIKKEASANFENYQNFKSDVNNIIRRIHLNYGFPNQQIMRLAFDEKDLYIGLSFLEAIYTCNDCKTGIKHPKVLEIGENALKKRFILKEEFVGPVVAVEFLLPKTQKSTFEIMLLELGYEFKGQVEAPTILEKDNSRKILVVADVYIRDYYGVMISDVDLSGEENKDYFKVGIRN